MDNQLWQRLSSFHISIHFLHTITVELFLCVTAMRIVFPASINKVEVKTGVRVDVFSVKGSMCDLVSSSHFSCCTQKSFKVLLKHDAEGWEQLYAFCIWLRKTVPCSVCSCDDQYMSYPFLFLTAEALFMAASLKRARECVGFVDICHSASIALFHQCELDLTKLSSILMWSQENFFFPPTFLFPSAQSRV